MSQPETHSFQAEVKQILDIVIHSLYTDREIFVRELISNGSDAMEKLRFKQTAGEAVFDESLELKISIQTDETANTIAITDTGIGMNKAELIENIGTIAHSGSKQFLKQISGEKDKGVELIGQFGVGFYSAFMVAKEVAVFSRSFQPDESGWKWLSDGTGTYTIEPETGLRRGTRIVIYLKDEFKEYAKAERIESIIKQYSSFVSFPIELNDKRVNTVQALWTRNRSEIKDEEYEEFYKFVGHDHEKPQYRLHFSADAPLAIKSLLFVPSRNIEKMGMSRTESEVNLYCKKILIQPKAKDLFPEWLRFLKGVVDSEDLPLNISRESMQDSALIQKLNKVLTTRFIKFLEDQSKKDAEAYQKFFEEFGINIKEGVVSDYTHREGLAKLLRFESSSTEKGKVTSLADYVTRMQGDQKEIYFVIAANRAAAEQSPYYEVFKAKGLEVLFLYEQWDELVMEHLREFDGKPVKGAEKAEVDLESSEPKEGAALDEEAARLLANWIKESLGERVGEVRVSKRLVGSPAAVVEADKFMTSSMRRLMKAMKKDGALDEEAPSKQDLEINRRHPLMLQLESARQSQPDLAKLVVEQVYDNALVAAGLLESPQSMLQRMNGLLETVLKKG